MDGGVAAQWGATVVLAVGLFLTYQRNGKRADEKDINLKAELKADLKSLTAKLDSPTEGLGAIKRSIDDQKLHCARVSTAVATKVDNLEHEVNGIKKKA